MAHIIILIDIARTKIARSLSTGNRPYSNRAFPRESQISLRVLNLLGVAHIAAEKFRVICKFLSEELFYTKLPI